MPVLKRRRDAPLSVCRRRASSRDTRRWAHTLVQADDIDEEAASPLEFVRDDGDVTELHGNSSIDQAMAPPPSTSTIEPVA